MAACVLQHPVHTAYPVPKASLLAPVILIGHTVCFFGTEKSLAFRTGHIFSLAHSFVTPLLYLAQMPQSVLCLRPPLVSTALLCEIPSLCSALQGRSSLGWEWSGRPRDFIPTPGLP